MSTRGALLALLLALGCCALCGSAARLSPDGRMVVTSDVPGGGLRGSSKAWLSLLRGGSGSVQRKDSKKEAEEESGLQNRMLTIRFFVPPHMSSKFEDEWARMEDKEDRADILSLKASLHDNLVYYSYGEWPQHRDLHDHLTSGHFNDFASWVDDKGIPWEMELLEDWSRDQERERGQRRVQMGRRRPAVASRRADLGAAALSQLPNAGLDATDAQVAEVYKRALEKGKKNDAHVLIKYMVKPGLADDFVDAWAKCADETTKEKGNHVYSLRRTATDNVHWYTYGTWESMQHWVDHLDSKHVGKLLDFLDNNDIVFFITVLEHAD